MRIPALHALQVVIRIGAVRMHRWKGTILEGLAKCWTEVKDAEAMEAPDAEQMDQAALKEELKATCAALVLACPSIADAESAELISLDSMFGELFGKNATVS
jgi:hypothetical protein